ncbi:hypothetical protein [Streptomyces sp. NPDC053367]|uniref:hypothetical protein n=1 Tax=Streptomyces sp. NPDC053367 TaxID=3365700 RepID=UPI0037D74ABA
MSRSPISGLWRLSAVLLVSSAAVTFLVSAALDLLAERAAQNRRARQQASVGPASDVTVTEETSTLERQAIPEQVTRGARPSVQPVVAGRQGRQGP